MIYGIHVFYVVLVLAASFGFLITLNSHRSWGRRDVHVRGLTGEILQQEKTSDVSSAPLQWTYSHERSITNCIHNITSTRVHTVVMWISHLTSFAAGHSSHSYSSVTQLLRAATLNAIWMHHRADYKQPNQSASTKENVCLHYSFHWPSKLGSHSVQTKSFRCYFCLLNGGLWVEEKHRRPLKELTLRCGWSNAGKPPLFKNLQSVAFRPEMKMDSIFIVSKLHASVVWQMTAK